MRPYLKNILKAKGLGHGSSGRTDPEFNFQYHQKKKKKPTRNSTVGTT
jgi:hypothetical protein